ncbi:MAG TPA: MFS transporter [Holophaga sp.]|nr:MFS transporter [Holophaga sp.]
MAASDGTGIRERSAFGTAYFLSAFGYEVLFFCMTLRVYDISRKAIDVGVFTAITLLPKLVSPACGAIVDRLGAKRTLVGAALLTALLAMGLPLADGLDPLYALWFLLSILFMIQGNARTVLMTQVTESGAGYIGGNALAFSLLNAARLAAPLCAGLLSRSLGTGGLTLMAAGGYSTCAASAACLVAGRRSPRLERGGVAAALIEGFSRIRLSRELRLLVGLSSIRNFFLGFMPSLLVVLITGWLGRTGAEYGIALTAAALGSLGGSLAGPVITRLVRQRLVLGFGLGLHFLSFALLGLVKSYAATVTLLVAGSFALYVAAIVVHAKRDEVTDLAIRGRVYGSNTTLQAIPSLLSMLVAGVLADRFGVAPIFFVSGLMALAVLAVVSIGIAPRDRELGSTPLS